MGVFKKKTYKYKCNFCPAEFEADTDDAAYEDVKAHTLAKHGPASQRR